MTIPNWWLILSAVFFAVIIILFLVIAVAALKISRQIGALAPKLERAAAKVESVADDAKQTLFEIKIRTQTASGSLPKPIEALAKLSPALNWGLVAYKVISALRAKSKR